MADDDETLWALIDESRTRGATAERQAAWIEDRLRRLDKVGIQRFDRGFWKAMHRAYNWDLWGVANLANGHNGQEGFLGFRAWVVSRGKDVFDAAIADADSLAQHVAAQRSGEQPLCDAEGLCHVARNAYEAAHGTELPTPTLDLFVEPVGEPLVASELSTRFPRVAAALAGR